MCLSSRPLARVNHENIKVWKRVQGRLLTRHHVQQTLKEKKERCYKYCGKRTVWKRGVQLLIGDLDSGTAFSRPRFFDLDLWLGLMRCAIITLICDFDSWGWWLWLWFCVMTLIDVRAPIWCILSATNDRNSQNFSARASDARDR